MARKLNGLSRIGASIATTGNRIQNKEAEAVALIYDPPSGWMHGFPKPYRPLPGETIEQTLLRDGYPQKEIDAGGARHCRFIGRREDLDQK